MILYYYMPDHMPDWIWKDPNKYHEKLHYHLSPDDFYIMYNISWVIHLILNSDLYLYQLVFILAMHKVLVRDMLSSSCW